MIAFRVQVSAPKCATMNEAFRSFTLAYPRKRGYNTPNITPNTSFQKPVRLPAGSENILISTASRLHSLLTKPYRVLFCRWYSRSGMNLTIHHLVPWLQMQKLYLHLTHNFTLWWTGTDLTVHITSSFPVLSTSSFTNALWATSSVVKWNISKQTHGMAEHNRQSVHHLSYLPDNHNLSAIPGMGRDFFSSAESPDRCWEPPSLQFNGYRRLFPRG
jgi:hypothetical protein